MNPSRHTTVPGFKCSTLITLASASRVRADRFLCREAEHGNVRLLLVARFAAHWLTLKKGIVVAQRTRMFTSVSLRSRGCVANACSTSSSENVSKKEPCICGHTKCQCSRCACVQACVHQCEPYSIVRPPHQPLGQVRCRALLLAIWAHIIILWHYAVIPYIPPRPCLGR